MPVKFPWSDKKKKKEKIETQGKRPARWLASITLRTPPVLRLLIVKNQGSLRIVARSSLRWRLDALHGPGRHPRRLLLLLLRLCLPPAEDLVHNLQVLFASGRQSSL